MHQDLYELGVRPGVTVSRPVKVAWRYARKTLSSIDRTLALWHFRAKCRRELGRLDSDVMRDVGLDPIEVGREASKPFWRE